MKILAIESSCDEFSISINEDGKILSNVISSQVKEHAKFGGVVPELAARLHFENASWVLEDSLKISQTKLEELDYLAYTKEPGLIGSLIMGKVVAETLGLYLNKPVLGLDHIQGHIFGAQINDQFVYPVLALVVSGGHTQIELVNSPTDFKILGQTMDDAIGECYDKVARVLGMNYPGGHLIDRAAQKGNPDRYSLPLPKNDESYDFSYSGLKTAAINLLHNLAQRGESVQINDFCASFQKAATQVAIQKLEKAIEQFQPATLTIAGGVSANSQLRKDLVMLGQKYGIQKTIIPDLEYCGDNGAMIGALANEILKNS
jgi:N6-L-threonylcarbamoyladenine synthase